MATTELRCPRCLSTQLTANKKGFSGKQAVAGAILTGGIGLLAGTIGSNAVKITCLSCGHQFKPGDDFESLGIKLMKQKHDAEEGLKTIKSPAFLIFIVTALLIFAFLFIAIELRWI